MRILITLIALLPCLAFGQGFGSFYHDQPYLAKSESSGGSTPFNWSDVAVYYDFDALYFFSPEYYFVNVPNAANYRMQISTSGQGVDAGGKVGNCIRLFSKDAVTILPSTPDADVFSVTGSNSMTFTMWVNCTNLASAASHLPLAKYTTTAGVAEYRFSMATNNYALLLYTNGAGFVYLPFTNVIPTNSTWAFMCAEVDMTNYYAKLRVGTESSLYAWTNSAVFAGFGPNGQGTNTTAFVWMNGNGTPTSSGFNGLIDELGIWRRLLTDEEITNLWNNGSGRTYGF